MALVSVFARGVKDSVRNSRSYFAAIPAEGENHTWMTDQNAGCISPRRADMKPKSTETHSSPCVGVFLVSEKDAGESAEPADCTRDRMPVRKALKRNLFSLPIL